MVKSNNPAMADFPLINSGKFEINPIAITPIPIACNNFASVIMLRWFFGITKRTFYSKLDREITIRTGPFFQVVVIVCIRSVF